MKRENQFKKGLTLKQQRFCELYTTTTEFFGDGTASYQEAYKKRGKLVAYDTARVNASQLLTKPNILLYLNSLLKKQGLNDQNVDKQLLFLINQHGDLKMKLGGVKEYNVLKQRIQDKIKIELPDITKIVKQSIQKIYGGQRSVRKNDNDSV